MFMFVYTLLLCHIHHVEDGDIPKDILYGEPALGRRTTGRPHLRYKDVCVRDVKSIDIDSMSWEGLAADRTKCRNALKQHLMTGVDKLLTATADKRARRMEGSNSIKPETTHTAVNGARLLSGRTPDSQSSEPVFESPFATVSKIGHYRSLH